MISRNDRDDAANLITAFLQVAIDESHTEIWHRIYGSTDTTVRHTCKILADYHEGYENEVQSMDKSEWDHLERLRLVLLSEAILQRRSRFVFGWRRLLAGIGVIAYCLFWYRTGYGSHLLIASSILGILTLAVLKFLPNRKSSTRPFNGVIKPFATFHQLETIYRSTTRFQKNKFPKAWRNGNSGFAKSFCLCLIGFGLLVLSPVVLLTFCVPDCEPEFTVIAT